ncbi:MAG TPA: hypothetical protein VJ324_01010 [Candidatus Acidoferrum sp.]|jgi:hypothetical protein|nr:hypothetical protein [Candidatus Acidoferrum sp.]
MKLKIRLFLGSAVLASALLSVSFAGAQQQQAAVAQANATYDASRETTLVGKVLSYTTESSVPPIGAHVTIQTAYGPVDVHIGSAKLLEQNHFTLAAGDSVRITGEVISIGQSNTFAARIIENGTQSVTVRNSKGQILQMPAVHAPRGAR